MQEWYMTLSKGGLGRAEWHSGSMCFGIKAAMSKTQGVPELALAL